MNKYGLYDIYGMRHVPFWHTKIFYWSAGIGALIIAACILYVALRWCIRKWSNVHYTPWQRALHALERITISSIISRSEADRFYSTITVIVKAYVKERYSIDAHAQTDAELITSLEKLGLEPDLVEGVRDLVRDAVAVKFAYEGAMADQVRKHHAISVAFVKRTVPQQTEAQSGTPREPAAQ
jgi:hypothetical protein